MLSIATRMVEAPNRSSANQITIKNGSGIDSHLVRACRQGTAEMSLGERKPPPAFSVMKQSGK